MFRRLAPTRQRVPVKVTAPKYSLPQRIADNLHGYQDARRHQGVDLDELAWCSRLLATATETDSRLLAEAQDDAEAAVIALRAGIDHVRELDRRIGQARQRLEGRGSVDELARRGAEMHLGDQAVAVRRQRDAARREAAMQGHLDQLDAERSRVVAQCAQLEAQLIERFELTKTLSSRNCEYFARRLATYARQLQRRHQTPIERLVVHPPPWVLGPCPWIPAPMPSPQGAHPTEGHLT